MRDWETNFSFVFFFLTSLVGIYILIQVVMFPFAFRTNLGRTNVNNIKLFQLMQLEPLKFYQDKFSTHNLFSKPEAVITTQTSNLAQLLKPYVLIGIVRGIEPEALIQNNLTKQTLFVQADEQFDQFKLVEIKDHSILVEYGGEQQELYIEENRV